MPQVCALSGCEAINTNIHAEKQGQFFDLHDILFSSSRRSKSSSTQVRPDAYTLHLAGVHSCPVLGWIVLQSLLL
jgi:hypothetical protein